MVVLADDAGVLEMMSFTGMVKFVDAVCFTVVSQPHDSPTFVSGEVLHFELISFGSQLSFFQQ